jgi:hypothetical protein
MHAKLLTVKTLRIASCPIQTRSSANETPPPSPNAANTATVPPPNGTGNCCPCRPKPHKPKSACVICPAWCAWDDPARLSRKTPACPTPTDDTHPALSATSVAQGGVGTAGVWGEGEQPVDRHKAGVGVAVPACHHDALGVARFASKFVLCSEADYSTFSLPVHAFKNTFRRSRAQRYGNHDRKMATDE